MIARRDLIMGGACLVASGVGYGLKPRKTLNLLGKRKLSTVIPTAVGSWRSTSGAGLVQPETEGRLASRLYSETVSRIYEHRDTGESIMMLIAYGDTQSDLLQLHRPEACYPAVGFRVTMSTQANIPIRDRTTLPGRRVIALRSGIQENIIYWTRLGEYLPVSGGEQRAARLLTAMQGFVADGGLFRISMLGEPEPCFKILDHFASDVILSVTKTIRPALIGTALSLQLS